MGRQCFDKMIIPNQYIKTGIEIPFLLLWYSFLLGFRDSWKISYIYFLWFFLDILPCFPRNFSNISCKNNSKTLYDFFRISGESLWKYFTIFFGGFFQKFNLFISRNPQNTFRKSFNNLIKRFLQESVIHFC